MPILYAEIQVAGLSASCAVAAYSFDQTIDHEGRPSTTVHLGLLKTVLTGEAAAWPGWEALMLDPYRRSSGHLLFFEGEGQTAKRYTFYDAALVHYQCRFDARGQRQEAALRVELHFSAATAEVQGQRLEAHSLIPWATDLATSFRALTKPPEPLPAATLATVMRIGALKAETLASGVLKRVITPAGEVATEFLGVGIAAIARAASLTLGFVLTPANNPDAPGYDAEKNFLKDHLLLPPDPAAFRLAQLDQLREQGKLTDAEQAEYVALLAKVKGIRVQSLDDLDVTGRYKKQPQALPGFHFEDITYTKRSKADTEALRRKFDSSVRAKFMKKISADNNYVAELRAAGFDDQDLKMMQGSNVPSGWQVHHKLPLDDGGDNSFNNLLLIKNTPYHSVVTGYQKTNTGHLTPGQSVQVKWPMYSRGIVYPAKKP